MTSPREIRIAVNGRELTCLRATELFAEKFSEQLMLVQSVGLSKYIIDMSKADAEALHSALLDQVVRVGFDDDFSTLIVSFSKERAKTVSESC